MPCVPRRPRRAWLLAFALTVAGWLTAHELAYRLVIPHPHARSSALAETGHAYLAYASLAAVLCLMFALLCTAGLVARARSQELPPRRLLIVFVLLPPLAFALQEHLERLLTSGDLPHAAALEPTFLVGILLQLPFGLAAVLAARALVSFARALALRLASPRRPELVSVELSWPPVHDGHRPRLSALALGRSERGPPLAATR
jgi:hypothetical protein